MRSRSEVLKAKKGEAPGVSIGESEATPTTAPKVEHGSVIACTACETVSPIDKCATRGDGEYECPTCGCACTPSASTRVDAAPEKKWCGECATEVTTALGANFRPCGHASAELVTDPRDAKKIKPAAAMQTRTEAEIARRNAVDPRPEATAQATARPAPARPVGNAAEALGPSGAGQATVTPMPSGGVRLSVPWGKARCPIDRFNSFEVGGHIATIDLPPGADVVEEGKILIAKLEKLADLSFDRQHAWYQKKLKLLGADDE